MSHPDRFRGWVVAGAVLSALGASACCILPVAVALLGVGSAALGTRLEPLRPYLLATTVLLLGLAVYKAYRPLECAPGEVCAVPPTRRRFRIVLWLVTAVALALVTFPYYASWLF
ncbi:MAG: mercuric transporter MerT family protein [Thermoanaerobaculia bacterium]